MGSCLQDIIVDQYLTKGSYGAVYAVRYKGKECVMKLVVNRDILDKETSEYLLDKTRIGDAVKEADNLRKASELKIGPKFYDFRICKVKLPYYFDYEEVQIGIFILEKLDFTLKEYFERIEKKNKSKEILNETYKQHLGFVDEISLKIENDCLLAKKNKLYITDIHSGNIMFRGNTPIISDWGITISDYDDDCERIKHNLRRDLSFYIGIR